MSSVPMITTNFDQTCITISKNVRVSTIAALKLWPKEYPSIVELEKGEYRTQKTMAYEGTGALPVVNEGQNPTSKQLVEGYIESATHQTFMSEMSITWEMQTFAEANERFQNLIGQYQARSSMLVLEYEPANFLTDGFTNAICGDGQPVFSASHVYKVGTPYSTLLTPADLDKTSLEVALTAATSQVMEYNIPGHLNPKQVGIGNSNIFTLPELLKSTLDPESANNTWNAFTDWGLSKFRSHYVGNPDMWWIDTNINSRIMYQAGSGVKMWAKVQENNTLSEFCGVQVAVGPDHIYASFGNEGI